jgi:hypothetical protein
VSDIKEVVRQALLDLAAVAGALNAVELELSEPGDLARASARDKVIEAKANLSDAIAPLREFVGEG